MPLYTKSDLMPNENGQRINSNEFSILPPLGIEAKRAGSGIVSMRGEHHSQLARSFRGSVSNVAKASRLGQVKSPSFVQTTAEHQQGEHQASITRNGPAGTAAKPSLSTDTSECSTAAVRVLRVRFGKREEPVFNLTVDGEPEYFANGILVHNCDATRYLVHYLDSQAGFRTKFAPQSKDSLNIAAKAPPGVFPHRPRG
jgi:hypothetical protein